MSIIDSIQLSGSSYDVRDKSATTVVSLTQQEYDALPSSAKTANILYNITDATAGDLTQYWTSAQTQSAITEAVSGKQDVLVSGTNIKTINNESILGSGNITIQGGGTDTGTVQTMIDQSISGKADSSTVTALTNTVTGHTADTSIHVTTAQTAAWDAKSDFSGSYNDLTNKLSAGTNVTIVDNVISAEGGGKAIEAGRGISVTTGETADTVSFNLPISAGTGVDSIKEGDRTTASGDYSHTEGGYSTANGNYSHAEGMATITYGMSSHAEGYVTEARNKYEHASGAYNVSSSATTEFGHSGNTLFSVGNGTSSSAKHNAFEIRQNGDIYLTKDGQDVKLQDQLGSGGGEVSSAITSGDTNAVAGGAVFDAVVYSGNTYTTELTFDADGYAENWIVGQSAITIDVSGYTSDTRAYYHFEDSNGEILGDAHIFKNISTWWSSWNNSSDNCTITTDGDTATTATITDIPSGTVKVRRIGEDNPPKAIISGETPETWIKDALDDHRDNTTVHITAAERTSWNNKSNFSGSYNDLTDKPIPDSALNVASRNPVQNQALYSELRISNGGEAETTLTFEDRYSTNYPNGCTKIKVEDISSSSMNNITFEDGEGHSVGNIYVSNWGSIAVDTSYFQGATYEISGTTVIISYPTVTTVARLNIADNAKYTYKAITSSTTPLKDQVVTNTTALGGLSLVKLTQAQYDALVTKDSNTLYVIVN